MPFVQLGQGQESKGLCFLANKQFCFADPRESGESHPGPKGKAGHLRPEQLLFIILSHSGTTKLFSVLDCPTLDNM